jgi:hypothetical protein
MTSRTHPAAGRGPGSIQITHPCPVGACDQQVRADRLMCRTHWYQVPPRLRAAVWATWRSGAGAGTPPHRAAIRAAVRALFETPTSTSGGQP